MKIMSPIRNHGALLDLILDSTPLGITVLTPDLRYLLVNRYAREEFLKLPEEQLVGRHCYDLIGQHARDLSLSGLERACDACPALRALSTGETATNVRRVFEGL